MQENSKENLVSPPPPSRNTITLQCAYRGPILTNLLHAFYTSDHYHHHRHLHHHHYRYRHHHHHPSHPQLNSYYSHPPTHPAAACLPVPISSPALTLCTYNSLLASFPAPDPRPLPSSRVINATHHLTTTTTTTSPTALHPQPFPHH
ncbi:hypothetical protein E2C01_054765 [Portunus trituberculatus]|uniref:Uncharacterized protein n=1 Tax=Portunus trituberculatus TaxID=210409 RepID=A0A5B7GSU1_PORTR|nr:hypothetical protein [Portunus trituberculatus]